MYKSDGINPVNQRGREEARVMAVIVTQTLRGNGTEEDKFRSVREVWTLDGKKIAEFDPANPGNTESDDWRAPRTNGAVLCGASIQVNIGEGTRITSDL